MIFGATGDPAYAYIYNDCQGATKLVRYVESWKINFEPKK